MDLETAVTRSAPSWRVRHAPALAEAKHDVRIFSERQACRGGPHMDLPHLHARRVRPARCPVPRSGPRRVRYPASAGGSKLAASVRHRRVWARHPEPGHLRFPACSRDAILCDGRCRAHRHPPGGDRRLLRGSPRRDHHAHHRRLPGVPRAHPGHGTGGVHGTQSAQRRHSARAHVVAMVHTVGQGHGGLLCVSAGTSRPVAPWASRAW